MRETFRRIIQDIAARRNIEAYVLTVLAIVLAVVGALNDAIPQNWQIAVILATLGLLVFHTTVPERSTEVENVLRDRREYSQSFADLIQGARTLRIYGASNINILRNFGKDIRKDLLQKGGVLHVILQNPNHRPTLEILLKQLDDLHDLERDIESSVFTLDKMVEQFPNQVEYRFLDYSPGFSMLVVEREKKNGKIVVEFYGYHNQEIDERMHVEISPQESPIWYDRWLEQYDLMWKAAHPSQDINTKPAES